MRLFFSLFLVISKVFKTTETDQMDNVVDSLAWAELFFVMGMMFRRFDYKLYQTDKSDVRYKYDFFTPRVKLDSKGVRILVV